MDPSVVTVRAKYAPAKKGAVVPGVLMMTETRFKWRSNDPRTTAPVDHPFTIIKGQMQISPAMSMLFEKKCGGELGFSIALLVNALCSQPSCSALVWLGLPCYLLLEQRMRRGLRFSWQMHRRLLLIHCIF